VGGLGLGFVETFRRFDVLFVFFTGQGSPPCRLSLGRTTAAMRPSIPPKLRE